MENLNAEKIYKELTMFVEDMPTDLHLGFKRTLKFRDFLKDVLELIKSQEEKILSLGNRLKECENGYEGTLALERAKVKELTEENERLKNQITFQVVMPDEKMEEIKAECLKRVELDVKECRSETVAKFSERFKERLDISVDGYSTTEVINTIFDTIDQIAKEIADE